MSLSDLKSIQFFFVLLVIFIFMFVINEHKHYQSIFNSQPTLIRQQPIQKSPLNIVINRKNDSAKTITETQTQVEDSNSSKRDSGVELLSKINSTKSLTSLTNESIYSYGNLKAPAVLLRFKGGIGNQLFQYACHYALARKNNWPLYFSLPQTTVSKSPNTTKAQEVKRRDFALKDNFHIPIFKANTFDKTWNVSDEIQRFNDSQLLSGLYPRNKILKHHATSYCQGERFFAPYKDEIRDIFTQRISEGQIQDWIDLINSRESVMLHIRRGDFVSLKITVPMFFYEDSMSRLAGMLNTTPTFFIFSDDVDYVEEEFYGNKSNGLSKKYEIYTVSQPKLNTLQEFYLMTRCKHNIIPNSSFGWWAAYLNRNPNKIVFAAHHDPKLFEKAYAGNPVQIEFFKFAYRHLYYPYDWFTVDPFREFQPTATNK